MAGLCTINRSLQETMSTKVPYITDKFEELLSVCDAVYLISQPFVIEVVDEETLYDASNIYEWKSYVFTYYMENVRVKRKL